MTKMFWFLPLISGCGTISTFVISAEAGGGPYMFSGTHFDSQVIADGTSWMRFIALIDLPMSLALDVLFLPITAFAELVR